MFDNHHHVEGLSKQQFNELLAQLKRNEELLRQIISKENIIMTKQEQLVQALKDIDAATTQAGTNLATLSVTTDVISKEIDALKSALADAGVPQSLLDQAASILTKQQAVTQSLSDHATAISAIATKGELDPIPVAIPVVVPPIPPATT